MELNETLYIIFWAILYLVILITFIYWLFGTILNIARNKYEKLHEYDLTFLQVKVPKDNEIEISAAEELFAAICGISKPWYKKLLTGDYRVSFEIVSKVDGIGFFVVVPDDIAITVEKLINGVYPEAEIDIVNPHEVWDRGKYTKITELKLKGSSYFPIKTHEDLKSDTMGSLTSSMSKMGNEEVIAVQFVVSPAGERWRNAGLAYTNHVKAKASNSEKNYNIDTSFLEGITKKISKPGLNVAIRIISIADDKINAEKHIQNVVSAFEQFTDANYNRFVKKILWIPKLSHHKLIDDFIYRKINNKETYIPLIGVELRKSTSLLNIAEMASVFHLPNKNIQTPNIKWLKARRAPAPSNIPGPEDGIWLGVNEFRGTKKDIYIKEKDRTRHFYIIGQTGTGKSELLKYMALQDIKRGEGVCVIDPHGTDVRDLLEKCPPERAKDVIYFNVADTERPMGLNMLEADTEEDKHMQVNSFISLLYKLYDPNRSGIMGPQLERSIRNVMLTAMVDPRSSMVDVLRLLIDQKYSQTFVDKLTDPLVKRFWTDEVAKTSDFHKSEKMGYFVSKFDRFLTERLMRFIIGQPKSAFNFRQIMDERKILLVDLAKGKIGEENSNFLGLLLVPRILAAALSRHTLIEKGITDFPSFYLYVDEFQNFATPDFATILSEARKYKLNLIVAHQFVSQLEDDIKEAIFGNVGSMCTFRVGSEDGEYLEKYFGPTFTASDISKLEMGNSYVRLLVDGFPTPPFSLNQPWKIIHDDVPTSRDVAEQIIQNSRMTYGKPVAEVEAYINERAGFNQKEEEPEEDLGPFGKLKPKIPF